MVRIEIYGKQDCPRCEATKKKINFFLQRWGLTERVPVEFVDMDTVDGRAEGAFNDVAQVPTTIVRRGGEERARWVLDPPDSTELRRALGLED